ncbi:MAG TPA: pitrilysin family protein [Elusimicrobiota bacterium]|nr:pitrilysin family protein [Elusimicrobiota bacterium]
MTTQAGHAKSVQTLSNGIKTVVIEDHTSPIVSMQVWIRCGAVNENAQTAGVSHFLEHMLFKGTPRLSAGQISHAVESRGGRINAATGMELTHYYIDAPSDSFEESLAVLADAVLYPTFPADEFERERKVILEEIKRRNDDPQSDLWDGFLEVLYPQTPYRQRVIGTEATISAMTREVLMAQHQAFYVSDNMVVVIVGDVKKAKAMKQVRKLFGSLPAKKRPPFPVLFQPPREQSELKIIERPAQQAYVAVGFTGPALNDPRQVSMDVLSTVLGGGGSSRLHRILREEKRLVWSVGSSFITHAGTGLFGVFAQCAPEKARSLPAEIYMIITECESNGFSPDEVARAKSQLKSAWLFSQETYHGQASQWGFYTALGCHDLVSRYVKDLDRVRVDDLVSLLRTFFQSREMSGAVVYPSAGKN